jgi:cold shock protein
MNKLNGIVKFFNKEKGFGFIRDEASKNEYYVNKTGLLTEIEEAAKVEFELQEEKKGPMAIQVKKID